LTIAAIDILLFNKYLFKLPENYLQEP